MKSTEDSAKSAKTTTEKGQAFEAKVGRWAKKEFDAEVVKRNQLFKGKTAVRPFEVDIVIRTKGSLLTAGNVIWIECKDRTASIKRVDIFKLLSSAKDVKKAVGGVSLLEKQSEAQWDYLVFVSTSKFDADAINFAKENNMACYFYDGRAFQQIVKRKSFWS